MNKKQFSTFNDGVVEIYVVENGGEEGDRYVETLTLYNKYNFGNRSIGMTRQYLAEQNNVNIKKLIRIPTTDENINTQMIAIIGNTQYTIKQVQTVDDALLNHLLLTLTDVEERYEVK